MKIFESVSARRKEGGACEGVGVDVVKHRAHKRLRDILDIIFKQDFYLISKSILQLEKVIVKSTDNKYKK